MTTKKKVKRKEFPFVRSNTRIRPDQKVYIKALLKKRKASLKAGDKKISEGDLYREIVDFYKDNHKI